MLGRRAMCIRKTDVTVVDTDLHECASALAAGSLADDAHNRLVVFTHMLHLRTSPLRSDNTHLPSQAPCFIDVQTLPDALLIVCQLDHKGHIESVLHT